MNPCSWGLELDLVKVWPCPGPGTTWSNPGLAFCVNVCGRPVKGQQPQAGSNSDGCRG